MDGTNQHLSYTLPDALLCLVLSDGRYCFGPQAQNLPPFNRKLRQLFVNPTLSQWAPFAPGTFPPPLHAPHTGDIFQLAGLNEAESHAVFSYCRVLAQHEEHLQRPIIPLAKCGAYNLSQNGSSGKLCFLKWTSLIWSGLGNDSQGGLNSWLANLTKVDDSPVFGCVSNPF